MTITDHCTENWINVPTNSILTIHDQTAFVQDIRDQFYSSDPWQRRSAGYVHSKGLATNEKTATPPAFPSPALIDPNSSQADNKAQKKAHLGPNVPFNLMRSVNPQILNVATATSDDPFTQIAPSRERATISSGSVPWNKDVRSVTGPADARPQPPQHAPSQGNIKKKRLSLSDLPQAQRQQYHEENPPTPLSPMERTAFGDPAKIARFFPELTLS